MSVHARDFFTSALIGCCIGVVCWMLWGPIGIPPIDWGTSAHVDDAKVKAGGHFTIHRPLNVREAVVVEFDRRLIQVDCQVHCRTYALQPLRHSYGEGELHAKELIREFDVPSNVKPGKYRYITRATYSVNPLRDVVVQLPPVEIEVY